MKQLTEYPDRYDSFLAAFSEAQAMLNNDQFNTFFPLQRHFFEVAMRHEHLSRDTQPGSSEPVVSVVLTESGRQFLKDQELIDNLRARPIAFRLLKLTTKFELVERYVLNVACPAINRNWEEWHPWYLAALAAIVIIVIGWFV